MFAGSNQRWLNRSGHVTVHYQPGEKRSLDLEIFLEREQSLKLEVEMLGKNLINSEGNRPEQASEFGTIYNSTTIND